MDVSHSTYCAELSDGLAYLIFTPKGGEPEGGWPLLVFLHGAGERGEDLELLYRHGPPKMIRNGVEIPAVVIAPQCKKGRHWNTGHLIAFINEMVRTQNVNPDRVLLTGISMGGFGTWGLICEYPERFAAAAPICGGGELIRLLVAGEEKKHEAQRLPIWAIHGADDLVVPLVESERMVKIFRDGGNPNVRFTVYPGVTHDSWTRAYEEDGVLDWLLSFQRKA